MKPRRTRDPQQKSCNGRELGRKMARQPDPTASGNLTFAVCVEPSHGRWDSFHYIPERWLKPRAGNTALIDIMQPVSLRPDAIWTNDFNIAVQRLRSHHARPTEDGMVI
jgi:hypothetical protein